MNKIIVMGFLGKDPEERTTPSGQKVITFHLATSKFIKNEKQTIWFKCIHWGSSPFITQYLKKGSAVIVTGTLETPKSYQNKENKVMIDLSITTHHVEFAPFKKEDSKEESNASVFDSNNINFNSKEDEEIPF